jgi:DNA-binding IclR family transcriptional regulator
LAVPELLRGKAASAVVMKTLQNAVDLRPHKPGALLRRLRETKARGYLFDDEDMLAGVVYDLYWI